MKKKPKEKKMMMKDKEMKDMHAKKQSFWSKATGGRMK
jgi:hypothetical protein